MKRVLSIILALAMIMALIPVVFANGESDRTKRYEFSSWAVEGRLAGSDVKTKAADYSYTRSGVTYHYGWKYLALNEEARKIIEEKGATKADGTKDNSIYVRQLHDSLRLLTSYTHATNPSYDIKTTGIRIALQLEAPEVGFYRVTTKGRGAGATDVAQLYLRKYDSSNKMIGKYTAPEAKFYGTTMYTYSGYKSNSSANTAFDNQPEVPLNGIVYADGGDLVLAVDTGVNNKYVYSLTLIPITPTLTYTVENASIDIGEKTASYVTAAWTEEEKAKSQKMVNSFVAYKSSDDAIATISETGEITGVSAGTAIISATIAGVTYEESVTVKGAVVLPLEEEITDTKVNFKATAYEGGSVSDSSVQEVTIGTDVRVTATASAGYTFAYWKNSAGVVLSTSATETFKVSTNMGVIAVFDEIPTDDAIPVYFYNGNGIPLKETTVAKNTTFADAKDKAEVPEVPTLTGFVFSHWSDENANVAIEDNALITALTRAVAIYKDDANITFTVNNGDTIVASGLKYGESITVSGSDNFSCWTLGDKVISYEKEYTFDVYSNITLTEATGEDMAKAPVLVLDKVGENYFLTYDEGDYELIEAGILFGSKGVRIGSIDGYKAAAKRHTGQFTAQPHVGATSSTIARGYMICKHNGVFKVIYAD